MYHSVTTMNCYNNGIIYKLCCRDTTIKDIYIGSTCAFRRRKSQHKHSCNTENDKKYNINVYQFIRDHGGWDNWDMIEIKKVNCETKRELEKEERAILEQLGGTLNTHIPTRTTKEYREAHKEEKKEYKKAHYQKNKERDNEKSRAYNLKHKKEISEKRSVKINCDCGSTIQKKNKIQHLKTEKHQKYLKSIC